MNIAGLAPKTAKVFQSISPLDCLKPYVLVGGTALSLQLNTRLSEDLDFTKWKSSGADNPSVDWPRIKTGLDTVGSVENVDILGFDQAIFIVDGVRISFYAAPRHRIPTMKETTILNNIRVADIESIGIMKMETMMRRSKFRDYYDILNSAAL